MTSPPSFPNTLTTCVSYQKAFVRSFLNGEPSFHILSSPAGLGKSFAALAACAEAWNTQTAQRMLLIVPTRTIAAQWADMLKRAAPGSEAMAVDRRRWREIRAETSAPPSPITDTGILVLAEDALDDVEAAAALVSTCWGIVVVDDADDFFVRNSGIALPLLLQQKTGVTRTLLLTRSHGAGRTALAQAFPRAIITAWTAATPQRVDGRPVLEGLNIQSMPYHRSPQEQAVLLHLQNSLAAIRSEYRSVGWTAISLLQAGSSCLFTLEQRLRQIIARRNDLAHGRAPFQDEPARDDVEIGESDELAFGNKLTPPLVGLTDLAVRLLPEIESVEGDPKLERTVEIASQLLDTKHRLPRICIFTQFIDTVAYVADALSESISRVVRMTGQVPIQRRDASLVEFAERGGVLVSTGPTAAYPDFDVILFYDIPLSAARLNSLMIHAWRENSDSPTLVYAMLDTSRTLGIEAFQRELLEGKHIALGPAAASLLGESPIEEA